MQPGIHPTDLRFMKGGGEMGRLIRARDWRSAGIGEPASWPSGLRTAVRLILNTRFPMYIFWGPEHVCLYNDDYGRLMGPEQHPTSLGLPARAVWGGIWTLIGPQIEQVHDGQGATWHEDQLVPITRHGETEDSYWTYSYSPIDDESAPNGVGGVLVVCTETTRQIELAQRLAASQERLNQALSAGGGVGIWDWDIVNDRVFADERFARLYGVDPRRAQAGAPLSEFFGAIHADDLPDLRERIRRTLADEGEFSAEYRLVGPQGQIAWVLAEGLCEFDAARRPIRFAGVSIDITNRKRTEASLRDSEAHHRSVLAVLREGIFVVDPQGLVIGCNPAAERILGVAGDEWRGRSAIAPGWRPLRRDGSAMPADELPPGRVRAGFGPQIDSEIRCLDRHGRSAVFQVSAVPVNSETSDELLAVVTVFVDITRRRQEDEELRRYRDDLELQVVDRTRDLERANLALESANRSLVESNDAAQESTRAKSAFLANMSHEIRTPMNAIIGLTHLLSRSALDAYQRQRVGEVSTAAQHLLALIDDILDLSKIEAGMLVLDSAEFATADFFEAAVAMVRERAHAKGLRLHADAGDLPPRLRGDRLKLSQILINLLSNAVKFTETGSVRLRARVVDVQDERLCLLFEVQDTGPGIARDRQALLFNAFEQADDSLSRKHGGSGLGLALSRQLARAMGGDASFASEVGIGSTFRFTAWLERGSEGAEAPSNGREAAGEPVGQAERLIRERHGGRRVLLAEDNPINRFVAQEFLRSAGLVVETAVDGDAAVAMVRANSYDLVLMDMQMPVLDGLEATRALRAAGHAMPIIAMTANAYVEDRLACLASGMDDHVTKPVEPEALFSLLLRWLGGRAPH